MSLKDKLAAAMNRANQSPMDDGGKKKKGSGYKNPYKDLQTRNEMKRDEIAQKNTDYIKSKEQPRFKNTLTKEMVTQKKPELIKMNTIPLKSMKVESKTVMPVYKTAPAEKPTLKQKIGKKLEEVGSKMQKKNRISLEESYVTKPRKSATLEESYVTKPRNN